MSRKAVNGRQIWHNSLFLFCYKVSKIRFVGAAIHNIELYSSEFGPVGTYFDYVQDISKETKINNLVNLNIAKDTIYQVYRDAGIQGYKLEGATEWTYRALGILKAL